MRTFECNGKTTVLRWTVWDILEVIKILLKGGSL